MNVERKNMDSSLSVIPDAGEKLGKIEKNGTEYFRATIYLTKVISVFYHCPRGRKRYFDLGLRADAVALNWRFKSRFIAATSLRVGTFFSISRFCFSSIGSEP
jgi:hypothetical protein